ncbi:MAG: F0F1 ATP synthase subunit A [Candidatus Hydrogenedentota bacterium]
MEGIGERLIWYYVPFTDIEIPMGGVNVLTIFNTLLVMVALLALFRMCIRGLSLEPGASQRVVEVYVDMFDNLVSTSLEFEDQRRNRAFFPLIGAMFLFLLLANYMGFWPGGIFEEPTADVNTTLGLGIMGMAIAIVCGVREKGALGYLAELCGPLFTEPGIAGKLSALFFFPLNVIGELAKVISISFRLFGNILGSGIIIIVVTHLTLNFSWLAIGLDGFFIFFIGAVHAFVFTMLTLTYIAVAIK